ncbi:MAG: RIP metalloprotease RseP [Deltaproteobacteria bacterium]|jgi:regulator of sigma E protease|nr:RIP metalloprotease RseP [Deltaproteobacteria bacterium]
MFVTIVSFVVLLLVLIFVHELGHFLAAKLLGVRVERFSLGFPPKIYARKIGETVYQVCWLPLGGFVKLFGEESGKDIPVAEQSRSFSHKPTWVKIIIVFAGPFFNILFSIVTLWLLSWSLGVQHLPTAVGPLSPDGPAAKAGLATGDVIESIDGTPILYFDQIEEFMEASGGSELTLGVRRGEETIEFTVTPTRHEGKDMLGDPLGYWSLGLRPMTKPVIGHVINGKPADKAGLKRGDLVIAIDDKPINDWDQLVEIVKGPVEQRELETLPPAKELKMTVIRDGQEIELRMTPLPDGMQDLEGVTRYTYMVGVAVQPTILVEPIGPATAFHYGVTDTYRTVELTFVTLRKIISQKISAKLMGGPIMIAEVAGRKIQDGLAEFISMMTLISVNLAIINLVPLPVLDGGQILIFLIEGLRRKPINQRVKEVTQLVGVAALFALMILVFYNDISRIVTRMSGPPTTQTQTLE